VLGGDKNLARADAVAGAANLPEEERGVIRRFTGSVNNMDTIAVAVAKRLGHEVHPEAFGSSGSYIDFRGPKGTVPTYSFSALVKGKVDPCELRGKIVIVGASAPSLQD